MDPQTPLYRQIHPIVDVRYGRITPHAFIPRPRDILKLSVDDGSLTTSEEAFNRFSSLAPGKTIGVLQVLVSECTILNLNVESAPSKINVAHAIIDFSQNPTPTEIKGKVVMLLRFAKAHGRAFPKENPIYEID